MYPQAIGATPVLHFNFDPTLVACLRQGGKWDATTQQCNVGGGIPTWVYVVGGVAIVGAAAYYYMGK